MKPIGQTVHEVKKEIRDLKPWLLAARPKTLPISFIPIMVGTLLAQGVAERIDWTTAVLALLFSIFIQIGTNLINDALDFKKGSDTSARLGPKRITQSGLLSFKQVLQGGFFCFALAILFGIPLILQGGIPLILILFLSVVCGYIYTGGPWPLAYHGLGEIFVFIFYGLISTSTVYYLQTGFIDTNSLIAGIQLGLLACVPIAINNLRDIASDTTANKKTLAVRFGKKLARIEIALFILVPYLVSFYWYDKGYPLMALLPFLSLPIAIRNVRSIFQIEPSVQYNAFLGVSVLNMLLFGVSLVVGYLYKGIL
jgi:1,4-dihydroxy-2-naphthoate polyprenyltransferase